MKFLYHEFLYHDYSKIRVERTCPVSHHHSQRGRQHIDRTALQRKHLAIHHHIHRPIKLELNLPNRPSLRQWVSRVCAVIKRGQIPDQSQSPNRSPPHIFNQSVIGHRIRRDHHSATGKLAVVECQKQTRTRIKISLTVKSHRKRPSIKPRQTKKDRQQISELSQPLKPPMPQRGHICGEPHTQQIRIVDRSIFMNEPKNITGPRTPCLQRQHCVLQPILARSSIHKIPEK